MSFEIPEPFVWDETFKVFYDNLDEQHRTLFRSIFDMCNDTKDKMRLDCMISVMVAHFLTEEIMMKRANYPDYTTHKAMHDEFVMKLKGLHCPITNNDLHYCKDWLVNHIKGTDHKYKNKLMTYGH
uniref:Hemerythrin n=3 Tax=Annelida TaxID=6340 RepID=A0A1S6QCT2_PECGU|nr:hemerythrin [Halosydna brevisetosa]AQV13733.1 hemerythrin [Pectinaria gouldii]AQV13763.1 hemerythrin [Sparganophilus sp. EP-2017]